MQTGITIDGNKIKGTLKYLDSGSLVTTYGAGYFMAIKFSNVSADATSVKAGMHPSMGTGLVTLDEDLEGIWKVTNKDTQTFDVVQISGSTEKLQRFILSDLVLAPAG